MRRATAIALLSVTAAYAVNVTTVAAVTTIAVNALEITTRIQQIRAAAKATRKAAGKIAKKVRGR